MLVGLDGKLEYLNRHGLAALGVTSGPSPVGHDWRELWAEEHQPQVDAALVSAGGGQSSRFEAWRPDQLGLAQWWDVSVSPVGNDKGEIAHILAISRDTTAQTNLRDGDRSRRELAEQAASLAGQIAREMRHRFKNQLAVIGAVAKLLARHTTDAGELARKLEERLLALGRAQDLLTNSLDRQIPAREAIALVLAASGAGDQVELVECPDTLLGEDAIQHLALVLNELQTNALKHGALRSACGRIELSGTRAAGALSLRWQEHCADPVTPAQTGGGGFQLIRRIGAVGANQPAIAWSEHGIVVEFHLRTIDR